MDVYDPFLGHILQNMILYERMPKTGILSLRYDQKNDP